MVISSVLVSAKLPSGAEKASVKAGIFCEPVENVTAVKLCVKIFPSPVGLGSVEFASLISNSPKVSGTLNTAGVTDVDVTTVISTLTGSPMVMVFGLASIRIWTVTGVSANMNLQGSIHTRGKGNEVSSSKAASPLFEKIKKRFYVVLIGFKMNVINIVFFENLIAVHSQEAHLPLITVLESLVGNLSQVQHSRFSIFDQNASHLGPVFFHRGLPKQMILHRDVDVSR